jgi:ribonuclease BN (tRNA processing enzyme)
MGVLRRGWKVEITVVGSGTVVPHSQRRQSCVVVQSGEVMMVLDLGSGAVRGMLHSGIDPFAVDHILLTHFHPDHTADLVPLLFSMNYGAPEPRTRPLSISAPYPFHSFWGSICGAWGEWLYGPYPLEITELPLRCPTPMEFANLEMSWTSADHRPESISYRLEGDGGAFVYTGDTGYAESVVALARGAHTLLVECSFPDEEAVPGHLTPSGAANVAAEAGVERVVLTHLYPSVENLGLASEVGKGFTGEVITAGDGLKLSL